MPPELVTSPLFLAAIAFGAAGAVLLLAGLAALARRRPLSFAIRALLGLLLLALGGVAATVSAGMIGYRALIREDLAARIAVKPAGPQRFTVVFRFPDGREVNYDLAGDELYVDAHILKWHPYANMIGLHTAYELDRVAGRYHDIGDERSAPRTVHALSRLKPVDLYGLRRRHAFLAPVVDAEYGSATFVAVTRPAELELRVSSTGLLLRKAGSATPP